MSTDWRIRKKQGACTTCERPFEEGEGHFSLLLVEPDSLGRADRCPACFEASEDVGPEAVFWRTRFRSAKRRGLAVDFEAIGHLFLALEGREEERLQELRYLLTLLLMRKKRLKLVRVKRGGVDADGRRAPERMVLRRPRREEAQEVVVFDLTPERTAELRADLERIFEGAGAEDLLAGPAEGSEAEDDGDDAEGASDEAEASEPAAKGAGPANEPEA